ncbi:MAG TPA: GDSL-type esterase/lipase family protein [Bacteroidales bacterium]
MKSITTLTRIFLLLLLSVSLKAADYHVRIGFIGNSITIGTFLSNPTVECYPNQIAILLKGVYGDTCQVQNFAVSGRTMLKHGDFPIWNETDFKKCLTWAPDICFIMLGTNDSKPQNWDKYSNEFFSDYKAMIDTFKWRNPRTKFIVVLPPPAYQIVYGIRDSVILHGVIPLVDSIAKTCGAEVVDFYHPLKDSVYLFPDKIHPNAKGAKVLAKIAFDKIISSGIIHKVDTGYTHVTSLSSDMIYSDLRLKDSVTINWTTLNANEAFLNGQKVGLNGKIKLAPAETTKYTLLAKGNKSSDSLNITINVYIPQLAKMSTIPALKTLKQGDTTSFTLKYIDQKNRLIADSIFNVNWSVIEGYGTLINKRNNAIDFVADSAGTTILKCEFDTVSCLTKINVKASSVSVKSVVTKEAIKVYPNPLTDRLRVDINSAKAATFDIKLYDLKGSLIKNLHRATLKAGGNSIDLELGNIKAGTYMLVVESGSKKFSKQIVKK